MFITAWFIRKKNWYQPKYLTVGDGLKNVSSIPAIELWVTIKNDVKALTGLA